MKDLGCQEVDGHLEEYASGECDATLAEAVERHLAGCPSCRQKHADSERLLGLLDWHFQADAGFERLATALQQEQRRVAPRRLLPFARRLAGVAALLLVLFGLANWLAPPAEERPVLVANLRQAGPDIAPGAEPKHLTVAPVVRTFALERGSQSHEAYRQALQAAALKGQLPQSPRIDLVLEVRNRGDRPVYLDVGGPGTELSLELRGPGTLRLPLAAKSELPFLTQRQVRLAPGASYRLPIPRLIGGSRGSLYALYWTTPGRYMLSVRYRVGTAATENGPTPQAWPLRTFLAPSLPVQIETR
jgi:putative zinc finger protein